MDDYVINYTTINHTARLELGITNTEYVFLDLVCNLSNDPRFDRWCIAKKTKLAEMTEISEQHVHRLIKKFTTGEYIKDGKVFTCPLLLEKDQRTKNIRTSLLWYETVVIKKELIQKYREDRKSKQSKKEKDTPKSKIDSPSDFATNISESNGKPKKDVNYYLAKWREIEPLNYKDWFKIPSYRKATQDMLDFYGEEKMDVMHNSFQKLRQTKFVPKFRNPAELKKQWETLIAYAIQEKSALNGKRRAVYE